MTELNHYGVKGMHWGVRKARTGDLNIRASRLERVAAGKGSLVDKAITLSGSSVRNMQKSARREVRRLQEGSSPPRGRQEGSDRTTLDWKGQD